MHQRRRARRRTRRRRHRPRRTRQHPVPGAIRRTNLGIVTTLNPPTDVAGAARAVDVNRRFYDALWATGALTQPQRFNTWPLLSSLAASAPLRLEIGPGLRPRLPIAGTCFADVSAPALSHFKSHHGLVTRGEITALPFPDKAFDLETCTLK